MRIHFRYATDPRTLCGLRPMELMPTTRALIATDKDDDDTGEAEFLNGDPHHYTCKRCERAMITRQTLAASVRK